MRLRLVIRGRHCNLYRALINRLMDGIRQLDQDLMRPWGKALDDDRVAACVCPVPGGVIDCHMNMSHSRGHCKGGRSEYRNDVQIFRVIGNKHNATRERFGRRLIYDDLRLWLTWRTAGSHFMRRARGVRGG